MNPRLDLGGDLHFAGDTLILCSGQSSTLDAGPQFSSYLWNNGATTRKITVNQEGYYEVTASTSDGCTLKDGVRLWNSHPVISLPSDTALCGSRSRWLDAGNFSHYAWSTGDTTRRVEVVQPGSIGLQAIDRFGCPAQKSIRLFAADNPLLDLSKVDSVVCGDKTLTLKINTDVNSHIVLSSDQPGVLFSNLKVTVPDFGKFPIRIAASNLNCRLDTIQEIRFRNNSSIALAIDTLCAGYSLDAAYLGDANRNVTQFTWSLDGQQMSAGLGKDKLHYPLGNNTLDGLLSLQIEEKGCGAQAVSKPVHQSPDLNLSLLPEKVCLTSESNALATFRQNILDFNWDWGDGTTTHELGQATHRYSLPGDYLINLSVRTDQNCQNRVTKSMVVSPLPTVSFSIAPDSCLANGEQSLFYRGIASQNDRFLWDISDLSKSDILHDPGQGSGPLVFALNTRPAASVSLQVINAAGCSSPKTSVSLKRKPLFSFTPEAFDGCLPLTVDFSVQPGDATDQLSYHWSFGDGTTASQSSVSHRFPDTAGYYTVALKVNSMVTGCKDSLIRKNSFVAHPSPVAAFLMSGNFFSEANAKVQFENLSSGADHYLWNFGDGKNSVEKNPLHTYGVTGKRFVTLSATNAFGCTGSAMDTLSIGVSRIYPPTAFSPGAPDPRDREFRLDATGIASKGYHLKIISRWNDVVFECRDEIRGWDGKVSGGGSAPTGNYVWILEYTDFLGQLHRQSGSVFLMN
ncbi:MAG: PKD domain-containing protein [Marinilabiliales bacterium]|nr:PKD domain-containing protein [Marinilabiliales bacterium]